MKIVAEPTPRPLLYTSFDQVPAAKGASTHIEANARALGRHFGSLILATPGPRDEAATDFAPGVRQVVLGCPDHNVLGRAWTFRSKLTALLQRQAFDLVHFRSIFEGYHLCRQRHRHGARLVYEVNGLPSIELPHAYPRLRGDALLNARLRHQEDVCLAAADQIITVSEVSRRHLHSRGVSPQKISVIANGVDPDSFFFRERKCSPCEPFRVLYCGTLSPWQGVEVLLEALPLVRLRRPVHLSLVGPVGRGRREELTRIVNRLALASCVTFAGAQPRSRVVEMLHTHDVAVIPLTGVDRNTVQGCCPLKLLEAASAGCPAVASDLPVVRELLTPHEHYLPVAPDDPTGLALALWRVAESPQEARDRARRARAHVERHWSWRASTDQLLRVYESLLGTEASNAARLPRSTSGV